MNTKRSNAKCQDLDIGNIPPEDLRSKVNVHFGDRPSMFTKQGQAKSTDVRSKANVNHSDRANPKKADWKLDTHRKMYGAQRKKDSEIEVSHRTGAKQRR